MLNNRFDGAHPLILVKNSSGHNLPPKKMYRIALAVLFLVYLRRPSAMSCLHVIGNKAFDTLLNGDIAVVVEEGALGL